MSNISPYTTIAIRAFALVEQKEWQLAKAEHDLSHAVVRVPSEDMHYYDIETEQIRVKFDKKTENYVNAKHRR